MNKIYKYILILLMIIFAFAQVFYLNKIYNTQNIKVYNNARKVISNHKTLEEFNDELNSLSEKNVLSANKVNGKWYIKIKLKGNKEQLLNEISKLENYDINEYNINKNKDENSVILEISAKEST